MKLINISSLVCLRLVMKFQENQVDLMHPFILRDDDLYAVTDANMHISPY
jgi:hypothetical protein